MSKVKSLIIGIIICISVILVSIPLWSYAEGNKIGVLANSYGELDIEILVGKFDSLSIYDDSVAINEINPTDVKIRNRNGFDKKYKLYFKVDKNSTIDYKFLKLSIDNNIVPLELANIDADENYYYFQISEGILKSYTEETKQIKLWLDNNYPDDSDNYLIANFIIL